MSFNAKLFIGLLVVMAFSCGDKNPQEQAQENEVVEIDSQPFVEEADETIYKAIKYPCHKWEPVTADYKSETTNSFSVRITSNCEEDYVIIDTSQGIGVDTAYIRKASNYKHKVTLRIPNDSVSYFISKENLPLSFIVNDYVLVNAFIAEPISGAFNQRDTSIKVNIYYGEPDTDNVDVCMFNISFNKGVEFKGFEAINYDDPIYDANAN